MGGRGHGKEGGLDSEQRSVNEAGKPLGNPWEAC